MIYSVVEIIGYIFSRKEGVEIRVSEESVNDNAKITYDTPEAEVKEVKEDKEIKEDNSKNKKKKKNKKNKE